MLKDDAVPSLFAHNLAKQPQKRRTSLGREQIASKRQLCEDALHYNELESFEFNENTKEVQTEPQCTSFSCLILPDP